MLKQFNLELSLSNKKRFSFQKDNVLNTKVTLW